MGLPLYQLLDVSPSLVPVWVAGLWAPARDPALRAAPAFAPAYGVLFVLLLVAGGKRTIAAGQQNDERGQPVTMATDRRATWVRLWPQLRRLA